MKHQFLLMVGSTLTERRIFHHHHAQLCGGGEVTLQMLQRKELIAAEQQVVHSALVFRVAIKSVPGRQAGEPLVNNL